MSVVSRPMASTPKVTLAIVLLSETIFFGTLLASYAAMRTGTQLAMPDDAQLPGLPVANSLLLLFSILPAWWSAAPRHTSKDRVRWLSFTLVLGVLFIAGQALEFTRSGMQINDARMGGVFFALMSFHGVHVLAGMLLMGINLVRARLGDFPDGRHDALEVGRLFWAYVTAVWIILFAALYLV